MMRLFLILVIFLAANFCNAQDNLNQVKRISKSDFKKLKAEVKRFIPSDLAKTKSLFVKRSIDTLEKLSKQAHIESLLRHGYDTMAIETKPSFIRSTKGDREYFATFHKLSSYYVKDLSKKGINCVAIDEGDENNYSVKEYRFVIKMDFVSTMRDPEKSWYARIAFYFFDRLEMKRYELFRPTNYFVFDLIDKVD